MHANIQLCHYGSTNVYRYGMMQVCMYYGIYVYMCTILQVAGMHELNYAYMQVCKSTQTWQYESMQVKQHAGMSVCKFENIFVHMYACMHICKYQICKYSTLHLYECESMLVYKYERNLCKYASI